MFDLKKLIDWHIANAPAIKFEELKLGTLFLINKASDAGLGAGNDAEISPGDLVYIYEAGNKKKPNRSAICIDGRSFLMSGDESVIPIDKGDRAEVIAMIEQYKEKCAKKENSKKLPVIKALLDELKLGYKFTVDETDWSALLEISERTMDADHELFYSLEGVYGLNSDNWLLDSVITRLQKFKAEKEAARLHWESVTQQWNQLAPEVKSLIAEAKKLGIST